MQIPAIPLHPVKSSNIKALGYEEERQILAVEFASGLYHYAGVPKEVYETLIAVDSIGKHFHAAIKSAKNDDGSLKYVGVKVPITTIATEVAEKGGNNHVIASGGNLSA